MMLDGGMTSFKLVTRVRKKNEENFFTGFEEDRQPERIWEIARNVHEEPDILVKVI